MLFRGAAWKNTFFSARRRAAFNGDLAGGIGRRLLIDEGINDESHVGELLISDP
jgi:hypothetical protein